VSGSGRETEIKLPVKDAELGAALLARAGFHVSRPRLFERNIVFDTADTNLRRHGKLLRLRAVGGDAVLTYKGPAEPGAKHKTREEVEISLPDGPAMHAILERIGLQPMFRYEKYRTEFRRGEGGVATLDETPIGAFLELEGEGEWIDRAAAELGYFESDYITASYGRLYLEWCERLGEPPTHMTFLPYRAGA
jgi:adenylate cyclase, class 2